MNIENLLINKYEKITKALIQKGLTITTMESCTAGMIAGFLTDTEGSSATMKGAFITYSNEAKILQGVPEETIKTYGVYSGETANVMARACKDTYGADIGIGVTGTFGNPDPANKDSTVGEVFYCIMYDTSGKETILNKRISLKPCESRHEYKLAVADIVADELLQLLV